MMYREFLLFCNEEILANQMTKFLPLNRHYSIMSCLSVSHYCCGVNYFLSRHGEVEFLQQKDTLIIVLIPMILMMIMSMWKKFK